MMKTRREHRSFGAIDPWVEVCWGMYVRWGVAWRSWPVAGSVPLRIAEAKCEGFWGAGTSAWPLFRGHLNGVFLRWDAQKGKSLQTPDGDVWFARRLRFVGVEL